jgi:probable Rubsico expression protein CbbX
MVEQMNKVNLQEEYKKTQIEDILNKLEMDLVGLVPVKTRIKEIAALLLIHRLRKSLDLTSSSPGLHMSFTGSPGTGKTTVALKMADILYRLGYIRKGQLITVTRDDLVGQYIGHTAPKTKEVLKQAMGGVLFIDEAYYLYKPDNERDYGSEAIEILLQVMENQREDLVVIFAGYRDRMNGFYQSNPGLSSRVTNARSVRNALDRARMRQANRMFNSGEQILTKADLVTIEAEDIKKSRLFQ